MEADWSDVFYGKEDVNYFFDDSGFYFYVPMRLIWESLENDGKLVDVNDCSEKI